MKSASAAAIAIMLAALAVPSHAAEKITLNLPWAQGAEEAVKQAGDAKKPIAVCFIQNTCKLSMHMVKALHEDGRVYSLSASFTWLCVDPTRKDDFKWFVGKCGDAVEATPTMFFLNEKGDYADPALAGIEPARGADPDIIVATLRSVLSRFKKDIPEADKTSALGIQREADEAAKDSPGKALKLYADVMKAGEGWQSMEETVLACREAREKILQEGMRKVREALGRKASPEETAAALTDLQKAYPDSPVSRWAAAELERIKAAKKGK